MSDSFAELMKRPFILLLASLAIIAGVLFLILSFVSTTQIGEALGATLFVVVAGLVFASYVVGLMVLAFVAILLLTAYWRKSKKK